MDLDLDPGRLLPWQRQVSSVAVVHGARLRGATNGESRRCADAHAQGPSDGPVEVALHLPAPLAAPFAIHQGLRITNEGRLRSRYRRRNCHQLAGIAENSWWIMYGPSLLIATSVAHHTPSSGMGCTLGKLPARPPRSAGPGCEPMHTYAHANHFRPGNRVASGVGHVKTGISNSFQSCWVCLGVVGLQVIWWCLECPHVPPAGS